VDQSCSSSSSSSSSSSGGSGNGGSSSSNKQLVDKFPSQNGKAKYLLLLLLHPPPLGEASFDARSDQDCRQCKLPPVLLCNTLHLRSKAPAATQQQKLGPKVVAG
jgi:hypothetical protein